MVALAAARAALFAALACPAKEPNTSLTSRLDDTKSPEAQYLKQTFPDARPVLAQIRLSLKPLETLKPLGVVSYSTIGMAFDYRARYYLGITPAESLLA